MPRPCVCNRFSDSYQKGECRLCWLYAHDPRYRARWDAAPGPPVVAVPPRGPCVHLGGETGQTVACKGCKGTVQLKVFACALHGNCTPHKAVPDMACCKTCADHVGLSPEATRG